jgi:hypothetical protein
MKKLILLTNLLLLAGTALFAQVAAPKKLKDVQLGNILAPSPIKIDGKLNEWNDNFQAYNRNTRVTYLMANDDKNIYLVVKSRDFTTTAKIIAGGVDLAINTDGKKKEKDAYSVTFPVIENPQRLAGGFGNRFENRNAGVDTEMMRSIHQRTIIAAKEIKVLGFKNITDTLISIYNEYSIRAAIGFEDSGAILLEMAIPLKLLGLTTDNAKEMAYNIKLNGFQINGGNGRNGRGPGGGGPPAGGGGGPGGPGGRNAIDFLDLISPSDFWGKYTLAKK